MLKIRQVTISNICLLQKKPGGTQRPRPSGAAAGGPVPLLPPPPSGGVSSPRTQQRNIAPPPSSSNPFSVGPTSVASGGQSGLHDLNSLFGAQPPPAKPSGSVASHDSGVSSLL